MNGYYRSQYNYQDEDTEFAAGANRPFDDVIIRRSNEIIIARASVELYAASYGDKRWNLIDAGIIYLMQNQNVYYLILFATENVRAIWQREINRNIGYKIDKPYFHIVFAKDGLFGINFADLTEAEMFFYAMERLWPFRINFGKLINNFTTKFTNFFARKKIPPTPGNTHKSRFASINTQPPNYFEEDQTFHRDEIPTNPGVKKSRNFYRDRHFIYKDDDDDDEYQRHQNSSPGRVPKPPPLPPPVQNFHFTTNRLPSRNFNGAAHGHNANSFEAQIKHEARKRHSGGQNFFKYLP